MKRYEFAELSFSPAVFKDECTFNLFTLDEDDPDYGEREYQESWVNVLERLGREGWMIAGVMDYSTALRAILLQREIEVK